MPDPSEVRLLVVPNGIGPLKRQGNLVKMRFHKGNRCVQKVNIFFCIFDDKIVHLPALKNSGMDEANFLVHFPFTPAYCRRTELSLDWPHFESRGIFFYSRFLVVELLL